MNENPGDNSLDILDASLLESLVALDESLRTGRNQLGTLDVLDVSSSSEFAAAALCLLELEAAFPRRFQSAGGGPSPDFPPRIGRFAIEGILGSGGFGIVYKGLDPQLKRTVAIKVPRNHAFTTTDQKRRFLREAHAAAKLDHPHIVPIYETGDAEELPYIAYAYCEGPTLAKWCASRSQLLAPRDAAELLLPLVEATAYCHSRGILHRDIKPANVLLFPKSLPDGLEIPFDPRLSDLGLAKIIEPNAEETMNSALLGTPSYMSPEQSQGGSVEVTSDVYSLGATLYFLLTGRPPFSSSKLVDLLSQLAEREPVEPRVLNTDVDIDLNTICMKCLEKRPSRRFESAQELADELNRFLTGIPIQSRPISSLFRLKRWCERKPAMAMLIGGIWLLTSGLLFSLGYNAYTFSQLNSQLQSRNRELASSIGQLDHSLQSAKEQTLRAEANEYRAKQLLYTADIQRAAEAFKQNDLRSAASILNRQDADESFRDFCWTYLNTQISGNTQHLASVSKQIWSLALSSDGKILAAGDEGGRVHLYDVANACSLIRSWDTGQLEVNCVAFDSDAEHLATAGDDGRVGLWKVETGENIRWFDAVGTKPVYGVEFIGNGEKIVACGKSPTLFVWNAIDGKLLRTISTPHFRGIEALSISPDGMRVATAGYEGIARIYTLDQSIPLVEIESPNDRFTTVRFAKDGRSILTGSRAKCLRLWDAATGQLQKDFAATDHICSVAMSPTGKVVACENGGLVQLLDLQSPEEKWRPLSTRAANSRRHNGLVFARDGQSFYTGNSEGQIQLWQLGQESKFEQLTLQDTAELILRSETVCVDDQKQICYRAGHQGLECWDLRTSKRIGGLIADRILYSCKLTPDCKSIIIGDLDGNVAVIPKADGESPLQLIEPNWLHVLDGTAIVGLEISQDMRNLFVMGSNSELVIVEMASGQVVKRLSNRAAMTLSPDGNLLATGRHGSDDLEILHTESYELVTLLGPKQSTIYCIEFSPDGSKMFTTSGDRTVRLWNTNTWTLDYAMVGHTESVFACAISSDGRTLATGDKSGAICFWNTAIGQKNMTLSIPHGEVSSLQFAHNDDLLIATNSINEVFIYRTVEQ